MVVALPVRAQSGQSELERGLRSEPAWVWWSTDLRSLELFALFGAPASAWAWRLGLGEAPGYRYDVVANPEPWLPKQNLIQ